MGITPEDIERIERELQRNREALKNGGTVAPFSISIGMEPTPRQKPLSISSTRVIDGKKVHLVVTTLESASSEGPETYARKLRIEQTRPGGTQCRVLIFEPPALLTKTGIFLPLPRVTGRQPFKTPAVQTVDPWVVFDGSPTARRTLKKLRGLGMSFEKV